MEKWLLIPTIIFPYLFASIYLMIFILDSPSKSVYACYINNIKYFFAGLFVIMLLAIIFNIIFIFKSKNTGSATLIKTAFIIKCIQIPFYVFIFIIGLLLSLMFIMTFPLILLFVLINVITLWLGNMISIFAIIRELKRKELNLTSTLIITLICQFFFCADVISMLVLSIKSVRCEKIKNS